MTDSTLPERLRDHLQQMAPHQRSREAGELLADSYAAINRLTAGRDALRTELLAAIVTTDALTAERNALRADVSRLLGICQSAHDRLLRGDSDDELLALLEQSWKGGRHE